MERRTTMSKALITLTPVGKFFFGGDMRFETGDKRHDKQFASYIIHSAFMPQQTSLLGMLRFLLLSNDEKLFDSKENHIRPGMTGEVNSLIGRCSFCVDEKEHNEGEFGWIKSLGPCFIYHKRNGKAYFRAAVSDEMKVNFGSAVKACVNGREVEIPSILVRKENKEAKEDWESYKGKYIIKNKWVSADGEFVNEETLFKGDARIGIDKSEDGKRNDSAFYKQVSYRLKAGFSFALIAKIEFGAGKDWKSYDGQTVTLGADGSAFVLNVYPDISEVPVPLPDKDVCRVVLLSDAYIPEDKLGRVRFAMTGIRPFRFLCTENSEEAKRYNVLYNRLQSPKRYDLYHAGSVFYFNSPEDAEAFGENLKSLKEFYQIGYNHFVNH